MQQGLVAPVAQLPQHKEEEPAHTLFSPIKEETAHDEPYSVPADDDYVDEEIIDVPEAEEESDVLRGAFIQRVTEGVAYYGVVQDIEQGKRSGERLYLVKYTDGDVEHLSADEVRVFCLVLKRKPLEEMQKQLALLRGATETQMKRVIDILEADKKSHALRAVAIKLVSDGVSYYGLVLDIERGRESGERLYLVEYNRREIYEHLTADQVRKLRCIPEEINSAILRASAVCSIIGALVAVQPLLSPESELDTLTCMECAVALSGGRATAGV